MNVALDFIFRSKIFSKPDEVPIVQAIIIPGASVIGSKKPSGILLERLEKGLELYRFKRAIKIIISGDNSGIYYNEVQVMKDFCLRKGVKAQDLFLDHSGLRTLDTIYHSKHQFGANEVVIVTQKIFMGRALFLAESLGLTAYGYLADSDRVKITWQMYLREFFARYRAFYDILTKNFPPLPEKKYPLFESGEKTWQKSTPTP